MLAMPSNSLAQGLMKPTAPVTRTTKFSLKTGLTPSTETLASKALNFSSSGICLNPDVENAVIRALSNQTTDDGVTAQILKNAFDFRYQDELNIIIKKCDGFNINENVIALLSDHQISLTSDSDGLVQMSVPGQAGKPSDYRSEALVSENLMPFGLPEDIADIVSGYRNIPVADIFKFEYWASQFDALHDVFSSVEPSRSGVNPRGIILRNALNLNRVDLLDWAIDEVVKKSKIIVDFSNADLRGVKNLYRSKMLRHMNFNFVDLRDANLAGVEISQLASCRGMKVNAQTLEGLSTSQRMRMNYLILKKEVVFDSRAG